MWQPLTYCHQFCLQQALIQTETYINLIPVVVCVWFLSLGMTLLRFIHLVVQYPLIAEWYFIVQIYKNLITHSPLMDIWVVFQILYIINKAAINLQVFGWTHLYIYVGLISQSENTGSYGKCMFTKISQSKCTALHSHQQYKRAAVNLQQCFHVEITSWSFSANSLFLNPKENQSIGK